MGDWPTLGLGHVTELAIMLNSHFEDCHPCKTRYLLYEDSAEKCLPSPVNLIDDP